MNSCVVINDYVAQYGIVKTLPYVPRVKTLPRSTTITENTKKHSILLLMSYLINFYRNA